jgi:hypothetical protein
MPVYCIAGQEIYFSSPVAGLEPYAVSGIQGEGVTFSQNSSFTLSNQVTGFVGGRMRAVQVWTGASGTLLKVDGGGDVCILPGGREILRVDDSSEMTALDREILVGPALVLALAQCNRTWCLHASAAMFRDCLLVFLGESGQGKSTLAAYLSGEDRGWTRVADDILPVTAQSSRVEAWPHFPQLKLSDESRPSSNLPEGIPVKRICLLTDSEESAKLELLARGKAAQILIGHTAGARLFDPRLLADHLAFAAEAARLVPVYALSYPRRWEALAKVKELLEASC